MKSTILLWISLIIIGVFAAIQFSAFFFGFTTIGLYLIILDLLKNNEQPTLHQQTNQIIPNLESTRNQLTVTCPNCGKVLTPETAFCTQCGQRMKAQ